MTIYETHTSLEPAEVLERARRFFPFAATPYASFADASTQGYARFRLEVGEMVIAAARDGEVTRVRASASRGALLLARFLTMLGSPLDVRETTWRPGFSSKWGAIVEPGAAGAGSASAPGDQRGGRAA